MNLLLRGRGWWWTGGHLYLRVERVGSLGWAGGGGGVATKRLGEGKSSFIPQTEDRESCSYFPIRGGGGGTVSSR